MAGEIQEKIYTVPLGKAYDYIRTKRARRAVVIVGNFVARHSKVTEKNVRLSNALNSVLWARGMQKPPRKIRIKVVKEAEIARAYLVDEQIKKPEPKKEEAKAEAKTEEKKEGKAEAKTETKKETPTVEGKPEAKKEEKKAETPKAGVRSEPKPEAKKAEAHKTGAKPETPEPQTANPEAKKAEPAPKAEIKTVAKK